MNNKNSQGNRNDNPVSSSSIVKSPYNLRRNQSQPGAVTKRNSSVTSRKDVLVVFDQTPNHNTNSSISQTASNPPTPQQPLNDDEQSNESIVTGDNHIDRSDDEQEASLAK